MSWSSSWRAGGWNNALGLGFQADLHVGTAACCSLEVHRDSSVLGTRPGQRGSEVPCKPFLSACWQLEQSWLWAPLAWDSGASEQRMFPSPV